MADSYEISSDVVDEEEISIDWVALLEALWRERQSVFGLTLAAFVLATVIAFLLPPNYTSTVSFIPPSTGGSSLSGALAGQVAALGGGELLGNIKNQGDLYAGMIRSRSIASKLVKQYDLIHLYKVKKESEAEKILDSNTVVTVDAKSTIVRVDVTDKSPQRARDMANAYMDALRETEGRLALGQSSQRRMFFGQQLAKEKDDLEDAEVELKKTEEQSGLIAPAGQTESEIKTVADTRAQMALRQVQLAALRQSSTDENPEVIRLKSEIEDLRGQLARLQNGSDKGAASAIPASKVPELQLEYVRKEREVKYHEALFDALSKQYEAARLDEARDAPVLQVLDSASLPDTKSSPKRMLIAAAGLVLGFLGGCTWVLVRRRLPEIRAALTPPQSA